MDLLTASQRPEPHYYNNAAPQLQSKSNSSSSDSGASDLQLRGRDRGLRAVR